MIEIHDFERRLHNAEVLLEKCGISDVNKELIRRFVEFKTAANVKKPRLVKYIGTLRIIAERYLEDRDFTDLGRDDLVTIVAKIERSGLSAWSKHDYKKVLKTFYRWLGRPALLDWLKVQCPKTDIQPEELLAIEEVMLMIEMAKNDRDRALIAALYEGGFRIGEIGGLVIKNVNFDRYGALVNVSGKTGSRPVRLIFAVPYLAHWIEAHPFGSDRSAPLWVNFQELPGKVALDYEGFHRILKRTAERAGITKRVNPHFWRHSRSTFLACQLNDQGMKQYLGWSPGSKMHERYVHLSGRELDPVLLQMYGLQPEEDREERLKTVPCPHCRALNTTGARVCQNCRMPLTVDEVLSREKEVMQLAAQIVDLTAKHPEVASTLQKFMGESTG